MPSDLYLLFPCLPHMPLEAVSPTCPSTVSGFCFLWNKQQMASLDKSACPLLGLTLKAKPQVNTFISGQVLPATLSCTWASPITKRISLRASAHHIRKRTLGFSKLSPPEIQPLPHSHQSGQQVVTSHTSFLHPCVPQL